MNCHRYDNAFKGCKCVIQNSFYIIAHLSAVLRWCAYSFNHINGSASNLFVILQILTLLFALVSDIIEPIFIELVRSKKTSILWDLYKYRI